MLLILDIEMDPGIRRDNLKSSTLSPQNTDKDEIAANQAISDLIINIDTLVERKDPLIKSIRSPKLLIRGLKELQDLVEMVDIKRSIVNQIKFLITNEARKLASTTSTSNSKFEGHMLHSVISGNPGTGKTTVALILAKIWMALGFVKKKGSVTSNSEVAISTTISTTVNDAYRQRISRLETAHHADNRKLDRLKELIKRNNDLTTEVRRKIIKLTPGPKYSLMLSPDKEWNALLTQTQSLRLGFNELLRETDLPPINETPEDIIRTESAENSDPYEDVDPTFVVTAREDLIAEFLGQTAPKTRKVLESARGGVLFIDEAYSICNMDHGVKDRYGEECLNTINEFMSRYPDEIIIIFAGYKDKLLNSIFKAQSGLRRRVTWFFEIKDYTNRGLANIFSKQLEKHTWRISPDVNVEKFIANNRDIICDGGGSTEKLSLLVKIEYGVRKFHETLTAGIATVHDSVITEEMLILALKQMQTQSDNTTIAMPYPQMYS